MSAVTGECLKISCNYESDLKNHVKFICKGSDPSLCETSAIKVSSETNSNGRFSLRNEESAGVFTVKITDLTQEDSGIYWCGAAERGKEHKNKWISAIDLNIHDDRHALNHVTSESPKPTTTASHHSSKPVFQGFAMMVMLMVVGILTGFGFSLFMYFRWRQKKEGNQPRDVVQGPTEHLPKRDNKPNRHVSDYENISDTLDHAVYSSVLPVFDEHNASVYALAQLPSSPSDNLNY
ncbi:CMRF35-like molecule 8 [Megalobrama amblycephala]|uniref:CMRF35-like molecule 8 n=1 Tax=Megalobrama amblycephala TaxID=75352 RepID=UPI002014217E|nr:CMRF35-like molecule 8 [Megalobrama amblycephala]